MAQLFCREIDAEIYVEPPPGQFTPKDERGRPKILRLKKALYGTKQASKLWQDKLVHHLTANMGLTCFPPLERS